MKILFFLLSLSFAYAQSTEDSNNSLDNRKDKTITFDIGYGYQGKMLAPSVTIGYFYNPNTIIDLNIAYRQDRKTEANPFDPTSQISGIDKVFTVSIGHKLFLSNSFYVRSAIEYYEDVDEFDDGILIVSFVKDRETIKGFGGSVAIGNQWHFSNFTIGCDWIGFRSVLDNTVETSFNILNTKIGFSY